MKKTPPPGPLPVDREGELRECGGVIMVGLFDRIFMQSKLCEIFVPTGEGYDKRVSTKD